MRLVTPVEQNRNRHKARTQKRANSRAEKKCKWCGRPLTDALRSTADWCKECTRNQTDLTISRQPRFLAKGVDGEGQDGRCLVDGCLCQQYEPSAFDEICLCGHQKRALTVSDSEEHEHIYVLLGVGDNQLWHEDGSELQWWEIFRFLWDQFTANPRTTVYVGFFLAYDFINWLKDMPWDRAAGLLLTSDRTYQSRHKPKTGPPLPMQIMAPENASCPVKIRDGGNRWQWQFDILVNMKRFRLRLQPCACRIANCPHVKKMPWMFVCDTGSFFQGAFMSVINPRDWLSPIVTDEEWEVLQTGKNSRENARLSEEMRRYNRLENEALARVITELDKGFKELGIRLARDEWFSPGQPAGKWMKGKAPTYKDLRSVLPDGLMDAARESYMAGWWHVSMIGHGPRFTYETDINSAYPAAYAHLPCLGVKTPDGFEKHGAWIYTDHRDGSGLMSTSDLTLIHAHVKGSDRYLGAMLHRTSHGRIARPHETAGWYWFDELNASFQAELIDLDNVDFIESWTFIPTCDCLPPMREVAELYEKRLEVGKTTPLGKAAKLTYNSVSGKTAQTLGSDIEADIFPLYLNWIYASRITSECRTKILQAIASHPKKSEAVAMIATDSVLWFEPHPYLTPDSNCNDLPYSHLVISDALGEWNYKALEDVTILKPGFYWNKKTRELHKAGQDIKAKTRGISARAFANALKYIDGQFDGWLGPDKDGNGWPEIEFQIGFSMMTLKQALRQNRWEDAGKVTVPVRSLTSSSNVEVKCDPGYFDYKRHIYRLIPKDKEIVVDSMNCPLLPESEACHSYPYKPELGPSALLASGERDSEPLGISDDGSVSAQIVWAMGL